MAKIKDLKSREILDSRGQPTIETEIKLADGSSGCAAVPSGASVGKDEAVELRDNDSSRYFGMGVSKAVQNVEGEIKREIIGEEAAAQSELDKKLLALDGTANLARLGANAVLSVSLAAALAQAESEKMPLYRYFQKISANKDKLRLPIPVCNFINGGKHAGNNLEFQEFMILPQDEISFKEQIRIAAEVYHSLREIIAKKGYSTAVGDEGGFAPILGNNYEALSLLREAIKNTYPSREDRILFGLDVAANSFYQEKSKKYIFRSEERKRTSDELLKYLRKLMLDFPLIYIEDPFQENDYSSWKKITQNTGHKVQLVGDDLFVTNPNKLKAGIKEGLANSILIKPNQAGTLSKTIETIKIAKEAGYDYVVSHRSGETCNSWIADFGVGVGARQVKFGGLSRSERIAKYNRLLRIEEEIN